MTTDEACDALERLGKQAEHVYVLPQRDGATLVRCDHCRMSVSIGPLVADGVDLVKRFGRDHAKCKRAQLSGKPGGFEP